MLNYNKLDPAIMTQLVEKELNLLGQRIKSKGLDISLSEEVIDLLSKGGFDDKYGARPLRAYFQKLIVRPLSKLLVAGELTEKNNSNTIHAKLKQGTADVVEFMI